jgi:hypothetical protein
MNFIVTDTHHSTIGIRKRVSLPRRISEGELSDLLAWCRENFGSPWCNDNEQTKQKTRWSISVDQRSNLFFASEEDVLLLLLRWS